MPIKRCNHCDDLINYEREEEYRAHIRGCHYRIAQQTGQEDTYLGTAGRGIQRQQEYDRERERKQREWQERQARWQQNAAWANGRVAWAEQQAWYGTNFGEARAAVKQVQQEMRDTELSREDRETMRQRLQNAFTKVNERQDEARRQYEAECAANYNRVHAAITEACRLVDYGTDFRTAGDALRNAQQLLRDARPMKREGRDALFDWIRRAFDALKQRRDAWHEQKRREFEERQREKERKHREWQNQQRDRIQRLRDAIGRLDDSLARDHRCLGDLNQKFISVRPGRKAGEIRWGLQKKIDDVNRRILPYIPALTSSRARGFPERNYIRAGSY